MSDIIDTTGRSIGTVTAEIKFLHAQAEQILLTHFIEIGRRLVEAKSLLPHGEWGPWLEKEVNYSQRQAEDLMRVYQEYGTGQESFFGNPQAFAKLTYTKALRLLALPTEERAEFVERNDVENMSTRKLEQALKDLEEAKKREADAKEAAVDAQAVQRAVQGDLDRQKAQNDLLKVRAETVEGKAEKARDEAARLRNDLEKARADLKTAQAAAKNPKISDDVMAQIRNEAEAQAAMEAEAKAKKAVEDAEKRAAQAQKEADDARAAMEKARKTADTHVAVFHTIFTQVQQDVNRLSGAMKNVENASPETAAKLRKAVADLLEVVRKELGV